MTYEQYRYDEYLRYAAQCNEDAVDIEEFIFLLNYLSKYFEKGIDLLHVKV